MAVTVDELELKITSDSRSATKALDDLISKLQTLKSNSDVTSAADGASRGFERIEGGAHRAREATREFTKAASSDLADLRKKLDKVENSMARLGLTYNVNPEAFGGTDALAEATWDDAFKSGKMPSWMNHGIDRYKEQVAAIIEERDALREAIAEIEEFGEEEEETSDEVDGATESIERHEKSVRRVGRSYGSAKTGLDKFLSTVKRLVIMRAIRAAIREVAQGFSEGVEDLYRYSEAMDSMDAAKAKDSLDSVATSLAYMKRSVGAAVAPLIQQLVPVLQTVVGWAVQAANAINMFISVLQGKSTYTRAKENAETYFEAVKTGASGAGKAAKEALATLLAFDEINRLDADKNGSGGGGGGSSASAGNPLENFEEAAIELPEWLQWIVDNLDEILSMVKDVGIGLAAWVITTETINAISKVASLLSGMTAAQSLLAGGILLAIGVKWAIEGGYALGNGSGGLVDYIKEMLGIAASAMGGTLLLGAAGASGAGFVIGLTIGVVASVVASFVGAYNKIEQDFQNSELGKNMKAVKEGNQTVLSMNAALKMNFKQVTGEIDNKTEIKLQKAERLIEEIFSLDEKKNKTVQEIEILKAKVQEFNDLSLDGIRVEFNTTTQRVESSKEAVLGLINSLRSQYKLEALREAYIDAYKDQYAAEENLVKATQNLLLAKQNEQEVTKALLPYEEAVTEARKKHKEATENYNAIREKYGLFSLQERKADQELQKAEAAVTEAVNKRSLAKINLADKEQKAKEATQEATKAYKEAQDVLKTATERVDKFGDEIDSVTKAQKTAAESSVKYSKDVSDAYLEIQLSAKAAAGDINAINALKMDKVHQQLQTVNNDLNNIAKKRTVNFTYPSGVKGATGYYSQMYASGGYPSTGDFFWAGEAGPELVGTVGGRTAVASNQEITGITNAVYAMGEREVAAIENLTRALNAKNMTAVITADSIVSGLARKNRRDGLSTVPVSM